MLGIHVFMFSCWFEKRHNIKYLYKLLHSHNHHYVHLKVGCMLWYVIDICMEPQRTVCGRIWCKHGIYIHMYMAVAVCMFAYIRIHGCAYWIYDAHFLHGVSNKTALHANQIKQHCMYHLQNLSLIMLVEQKFCMYIIHTQRNEKLYVYI